MLRNSRRPALHLVGSGTVEGATAWDKIGTRLRERIGNLLNRRRVPGFVQPMSLDDPVTGQRIEITVSPLFTTVSVNGRDYFFRRLTGKFDGTGMGCS